jgi:hypothetical protein
MAQITFTAFVEDWTQNSPQHPDWGMKTAEPHRKKDGDQWVTTARTFRTVKGGYANDAPVRIDFTRFSKGDRVIVTGTEVTEVRESNGKKYYDLVCKATTVVIAPQQGQGGRGGASTSPAADWDSAPASKPQTGAQDAWATAGGYSDETPF